MMNGSAHRHHGELNGTNSSSASSTIPSPLDSVRELIIMTPVSQADNSSSHLIRVERFRYDVTDTSNLPSDILHVAGGQHSGIVVRKQITRGKCISICTLWELLEIYMFSFRCILFARQRRFFIGFPRPALFSTCWALFVRLYGVVIWGVSTPSRKLVF